jgi:hypothetical protein
VKPRLSRLLLLPLLLFRMIPPQWRISAAVLLRPVLMTLCILLLILLLPRVRAVCHRAVTTAL